MKRFWKWLAKLAQKHIFKGIEVTNIPFEDMLKETKRKDNVGTYELGYSSFSGVDTKVFFEYKDGEGECIAEIQAISWVVEYRGSPYSNPSPLVTGTIIAIVFDGDSVNKRKDKVKNVYLESINEYGNGMNARLNNVKFISQSYGVAIDDIVTEIDWTYSAESLDHWKKIESQDDRPEWRTRAMRELLTKKK